MENLKQKCLDLMGQKIDFLNRMVELTRAATFTGEEPNAEREVDAFVALYEKRTAILARIEKIDDALGLLDPLDESDMADIDFQNSVVKLREAGRDIAVEMLAMDKANTAAYEKLSAYLKDTMKTTRQTRDLSTKYLDEYDSPGGSYLDKKN